MAWNSLNGKMIVSRCFSKAGFMMLNGEPIEDEPQEIDEDGGVVRF